jgi:hypothetical protein
MDEKLTSLPQGGVLTRREGEAEAPC